MFTDFNTPEGFHLTSIYVRIAHLVLTKFGNGNITVRMIVESHISREKRLASATALRVPAMPHSIDVEMPLSSSTQFDLLYGHVKKDLVERGFTVEDVFETSTSQQSSESTP